MTTWSTSQPVVIPLAIAGVAVGLEWTGIIDRGSLVEILLVDSAPLAYYAAQFVRRRKAIKVLQVLVLISKAAGLAILGAVGVFEWVDFFFGQSALATNDTYRRLDALSQELTPIAFLLLAGLAVMAHRRWVRQKNLTERLTVLVEQTTHDLFSM